MRIFFTVLGSKLINVLCISLSLQEQYHKIIKDYMEFLDTAEQKLKRAEISATDATDLARQLDKHKVLTNVIIIYWHLAVVWNLHAHQYILRCFAKGNIIELGSISLIIDTKQSVSQRPTLSDGYYQHVFVLPG